jgi:putative membrane protein insertion efficiency factor
MAAHLTMRARARSNTALFRTRRWQRSGLTNLPRRGVRGAMASWCAAARAAAAPCFATGAPRAGGASGCSRGRQAFRARSRPPAQAKSAIRTLAAPGSATQSGRIPLLSRAPRCRGCAAGHPRVEKARRAGRRAQSHQALHPRGFSAGTGSTGCRGPAGAATLRNQAFAPHDYATSGATPRTEQGMSAAALRAVVRAYQWFVRPVLPTACRFYPSCSEYADEALSRHGAWRGGWLAARRLCRCGPWHPGGYDPVP